MAPDESCGIHGSYQVLLGEKLQLLQWDSSNLHQLFYQWSSPGSGCLVPGRIFDPAVEVTAGFHPCSDPILSFPTQFLPPPQLYLPVFSAAGAAVARPFSTEAGHSLVPAGGLCLQPLAICFAHRMVEWLLHHQTKITLAVCEIHHYCTLQIGLCRNSH